MLDNFREWLSDNLRYILLGLAGILLLVIAFFAVRLVSGLGSPKEKEPETQQSTEGVTEAESEKKEGGALVRDQSDVLDLVTRYYTARAGKDYDSLTAMCETFDDEVRGAIESEDAAVESYSNIMTYSKAGLTDGSYVVYIYFDAKLTGVNTLAPGLRGLYLTTNDAGTLIVSDMDSHPEQAAYLAETQTDKDVQALIEDVNQKLEDAKAQDDDLKAILEKEPENGTDGEDTQGGEDADGGEDGEPVVGTATGTMQTTTQVNVRGEASADATLYGVLMQGTSVEVLENLDSGWSKIRYTSGGNTIEGYLMSQYLTSAQ